MYDDLKSALAKLQEKNTFDVGQIVKWKHGMKNRNSSGPFIVVKVLKEAITETDTDSGSTYFMEPLDIVLGEVNVDGDFTLHHYDSNRFEPVSE